MGGYGGAHAESTASWLLQVELGFPSSVVRCTTVLVVQVRVLGTGAVKLVVCHVSLPVEVQVLPVL